MAGLFKDLLWKQLRYFNLLLLLTVSVVARPQDPAAKLNSVLERTGEEIPSDQVFIHSDRNLYHAGDTIWFQAYIRDSRTGFLTTESLSLYVMLLNPDHATVDSARFRIINSTVPGWLKVPDEVPEGNFTVLAFTSIDMNYSPEYSCSFPVRIERIIHDQQAARAKREENPVTSVTAGVMPSVDLRFLPEGGTFVAGIRQRLAFNAVSHDGKTLMITGKILDQQDKTITTFSSSEYGPGIVEFTPAVGDTYFASLAGEEFKGIKWSLPFPDESGITLRVEDAGNEFRDIIIRCRYPGKRSFLLAVTMNNILVFSEIITPDTLYRKRIQTGRLPEGTAFVTLYDNDLNPVAERMIFLNAYKRMHIDIGIEPSVVLPGGETELILNTTDYSGNNIRSIISVAVADSATGYYSGIALPDIGSSFLYDKIFYDNLPFRLKTRGPENIDTESFNILLMTYGWRHFHPQESASDNRPGQIEDYDMLKVINPGPDRKTRADIKLIADDEMQIITLPVNGQREAELGYDSLNELTRQILILPDIDPARNRSPVHVLFPENKTYTDKAKLLASGSMFIDPDTGEITRSRPDISLKDLVVIEPVTIKAPRQNQPGYEDKYARMFRYAGTRTMTSKDYREASTFEDILYKSNPFFINPDNWQIAGMGKSVYLRANEHLVSSVDADGKAVYKSVMLPALFVLDGSPIGQDYEMIATMPASHIASVTFMKGSHGFALYGQKAMGGVIFVSTKMGAGIKDNAFSGGENRRDDDLLKEIRIFRTETEYYIPAKEEVIQNPEYHLRPTVLWKSQVLIDGNGPVKIRFPNNLVKGTALITVNGISVTNNVGSGKSSYKVQLP